MGATLPRVDQLLIGTLPFAAGAAVSPTVLTVVILILASGEHARRRAWLFAVGGTAFTVVFILVCRTLLTQISGSGNAPDPVDRIIEGVLAIALVVLAMLPWMRKRQARPGPGRIQRLLSSDRSSVFLGLGVLAMALNGSTLIIVLAGSHHITQTSAALDAKILAAVVLLIGAVLPLVLPPLLVSLSGHRADRFLHSLNNFATAHQRVINTVILIAIAVLLAYKALG